MKKLPVLSGTAVCRFLERHGFAVVRQKGSHIIMQKRVAGATVTVPVPNHPELKTGTLPSILRQSGLKREDLGK